MKVINVNFGAVSEDCIDALESIKLTIEEGQAIAFVGAVYLRDDTVMVLQEGRPAHVDWLLSMTKENLLDETLRE